MIIQKNNSICSLKGEIKQNQTTFVVKLHVLNETKFNQISVLKFGIDY